MKRKVKNEVFKFRVDREEKEIIKNYVKIHGYESASSFMRKTILDEIYDKK